MASIYDVKPDSFTFNEELELRAVTAINRTWDYIGSDWLDVCENGECTRDDMFEGVMDADRLGDLGDDFEAAQYAIWLHRYHDKEWKAFGNKHFYKTYGY